MHISLRKPPPEPEPVEEPPAEEQETPDDGEPEARLSLPHALVIAAKGWLAWCTARTNSAVTAWVHLGGAWAAAFYGGWVAVGFLTLVLAGVAAFLPPAATNRLAARIEARQLTRAQAENEALEEPPAEPPEDPLVVLLNHLIGQAPGVHLKTLVERLEKGAAEAGQDPPSTADVEASLAAHNIPLRRCVKDPHGRVNRGVHRADLEAALAPSPAEAPATGADP